MARAFAKIAFTPKVQAAQARMGSRDAYRAAELGDAEAVELGPTKSNSSARGTASTRAPWGRTAGLMSSTAVVRPVS